MSEQDNRRMAEEAFAALNAHDLDRYTMNLDASYVWEMETLPAPVRGPDGARQGLETYFKAFPDLRFELEQVITTQDTVVTRWRIRGTQKGEFVGIAPTNKTINIQGCSITEVRNGKIVRSRTYSDNATLFQQLGVLKTGKKMAAGER
ncbi:MAG: ester cyclase [Acidobacteriia bacterium]|nr:ester cyclase [Terriglobia bacterium]